jgi:hypothetical protein
MAIFNSYVKLPECKVDLLVLKSESQGLRASKDAYHLCLYSTN